MTATVSVTIDKLRGVHGILLAEALAGSARKRQLPGGHSMDYDKVLVKMALGEQWSSYGTRSISVSLPPDTHVLRLAAEDATKISNPVNSALIKPPCIGFFPLPKE